MSQIDVRRLLLIGNLSIFLIGLGFAVRTSISGSLQTDIYSVLDLANSAGRVGEALGYTFLASRLPCCLAVLWSIGSAQKRCFYFLHSVIWPVVV